MEEFEHKVATSKIRTFLFNWREIDVHTWSVRNRFINFRFSPCVITVNHFCCPTNAVKYTKLRV